MAADAIRKRLNHLHDVEGMKWREIACMPEFQGIAPGTLCSFAKGYEPKRADLRRRLGLSEIITMEVVRGENGRFARSE